MREVYEASGEKHRFPKAWPRAMAAVSDRSHRVPDFRCGEPDWKTLACRTLHAPEGDAAQSGFQCPGGAARQHRCGYGGALDWQPLPDSVAARIAVHLPNADVADRADWSRQHAWIVAELAKFRRVFADRVKALRLDEVPGVDDADADPDEMA